MINIMSFKKIYRKILIWHYGSFRLRKVRCDSCLFITDASNYKGLIRHKLNTHCPSILDKVNLIENELHKSQLDLIASSIENENNPYNW